MLTYQGARARVCVRAREKSKNSTKINTSQTKILPEKSYLCRTQRQPSPNDTGELQTNHRSELTDIRHLRWYFFSSPSRPPKGEHTKTSPAFAQWSVTSSFTKHLPEHFFQFLYFPVVKFSNLSFHTALIYCP